MGMRNAGRLETGGDGRRRVSDDFGTGEDHRASALWADLTQNVHRGGLHRRCLVAVAGTMVVAVAATAGGYMAFSSTTALASPEGRPTGVFHRAGAAPEAPRGFVASGAEPNDGGSGSVAATSGVLACPMIPADAGAIGATDTLGSANHLFTRTTADGVTIRAYRLPAAGSCTCEPLPVVPSPSPASGSSSGSTSSPPVVPGGMSVTPQVSVELSDAAAVGQGVLFDAPSSSPATDPGVEPIGTISNVFGVLEGAPVWWVAVSVGPAVANAQMTFADGSTDEMSPADGVVVLARQVDASTASAGDGPYEVRGTLQLLDSSGAVIQTVAFPQTTSPAPVPVPDSLPTPVPGSTVPSSVPAVTSPSAPTGSSGSTGSTGSAGSSGSAGLSGSAGSMFVCPQMEAPANASAG